MLPHPTDCGSCAKLHRLTVSRIRASFTKVPVLSWCRICGMSVLLEVVRDYDYSLRHFNVIDDTAMAHKRVHAESGGWGIHWRLDEVMEAVFGRNNLHWPTPGWYEHGQAMENQVQVLTKEDLDEYSRHGVDVELKMLSQWINGKPRTRSELVAEITSLMHETDVWDSHEVRDRFELLAFKKPFAIAIDKKSGHKGSLLFQDNPRFYFSFDAGRVI